MKRLHTLSRTEKRNFSWKRLIWWNPEEEGCFRLISIFGEQKVITGRLKSINLVNHRILFEE